MPYNPLVKKGFDKVGITESDANSSYLKLDQTTPQTVVSGAPTFDLGLISNGNVGIGMTPVKKLDVAGAIQTNNQLISTVATGTAPLVVSSTTNVANLSSDMIDGYHSASIFKDNDLVLNTNPFGGRKLYINSIDNAMYAADKKWIVTTTKHLKSYGGDTYPKLNPDYVGLYTITGTGSTRTITNTPIPANIIVYDNDTLKSTSTYTYDSVTGIITLLFTPAGTIYVYGGHEIPQYLDSPVAATLSSDVLFNGSYEDSASTGDENYYLKVRITPSSNGYTIFGGYPYGKIFLSYYYQGTPDKAEYRVYNYNYRPHVPGWKKYDFGDFVGTKAGSYYIQYFDDQWNYGRTIMEFIIYGNAVYRANYNGAMLSQIDWALSRPNLSTSGATVTKFGANTLYGTLNFSTDNGSAKISINPAAASYFNNGSVGIGVTAPSARLHLLATTEQLRIGYDTSKYTSFTVSSANALTITNAVAADINVNCGTDKTIVLTETVYNDLYAGIAAAKVPAANYPDWATFTTNIGAYTFKIDDYADLSTIEVMHDYKEGTNLEVHLHLATNGLNNTTARKVKYIVYYTWVNPDNGTNVFSAEDSLTAELDIPANQADKSGYYLSMGTIVGTNMKIGAQIKLRIKRIAGTGTEPIGNPFLGMVGIHYQIDTMGSRQIASK